jgi:hypothetical protein
MALGCAPKPKPPPVPLAAEVAAMEGTIDYLEQREFTVPQEHWQPILAALLPAKPDPSPATWMGLGELNILDKQGQPIHIDLYLIEEGPGAFAVQRLGDERTYYRGGDSAKLQAALKAAAAAGTGSSFKE